MKKIKTLFIANIFPPMGGSGVQRSTKFVKYFKGLEIEPIVLTRECDQEQDVTLFEDVPNDTKIIRTKAYDFTQWPQPFALFGKVIARKILIPDADYVWYKKSLQRAIELIKEEKIECIYSTSYPYSDHLLARDIKRHFPKIPWIADFRDEWSMNPYIIDKKYSQYRTRREKAMEESVAKECDYFIANTRIMHENFLSMYPYLDKKSTIITNGFDEEDFSHIDKEYQRQEKFRIVHPGVIYGNRKIDKILKAMKELIDEKIVDKKDVEFKFIGDIKKDVILEEGKRFGLDDVMICPGYMSHKETILELNKAEVLLLILREGEGGRNIAPGKIYEYINSNRPILALAPKDGVAAEIVDKTNTGIVCATTDVAEIKKGLEKLYKGWKNNEFHIRPNYDIINNYSRKTLTQRLSEVIRTVVEQ
ncbi:glycosyltransferase [Vallitaleaceae bacterium 9-2]